MIIITGCKHKHVPWWVGWVVVFGMVVIGQLLNKILG